jgi:hypothetical protein
LVRIPKSPDKDGGRVSEAKVEEERVLCAVVPKIQNVVFHYEFNRCRKANLDEASHFEPIHRLDAQFVPAWFSTAFSPFRRGVKSAVLVIREGGFETVVVKASLALANAHALDPVRFCLLNPEGEVEGIRETVGGLRNGTVEIRTVPLGPHVGFRGL